ncbi:MAG: EamA family transporter [Proteobacteria bacterium]|nr:EamA family transporter [Pseudomonadota bacterium]MBU1641086.1 EamA family transporter [Pseudomonadota bacterium]
MNESALAVGASVVMHVAWNLIARQQARGAFPLWWVLLAHLVIFGPWGLYVLIQEVAWTPGFVALLVTSATANAVYFFGLHKAYEHAPVALVYPLVRSSPLLIVIWGTLLSGEALRHTVWMGIVISITGLWILSSSALRPSSDRKAFAWALLAMFATSIYSLSDKAATASIPSFVGLIGFVSVGYFASWLTMCGILKRRTGRWIPQQRIAPPALLVGGLSIGLAYALVIHAMRYLPSAEVVSYTNAGIVIATFLSIFYFDERTHWQRRLLGAAIIVGGLGVMAM